MYAGYVLVVDDHVELAQLLAAAIEAHGVRVRTAYSGGGALADIASDPPAAALVDLLLPDMLGTEVLDALAAHEPPIPGLAMSGVFRGDRYRHDAVELHGARAFFEKPFSTQEMVGALLELLRPEAPPEAGESRSRVAASLAETVAPEAEEVWIFLDAASVLEGPDEPDPETGGPPEDLNTTRQRRRMGIVEDLIQIAPQPLPAPLPEQAPAPRPPAIPAPEAPERPAGSGDLGRTSVARLLAAFHQARSSGLLELTRGPVTKAVHLEAGVAVFAGSNLAGDRLLTFAVRRGLIRREDAEAALRLAQESGRRVGELLLDLGVLERPSLQALVRDQMRALVWSTFSWDEGRYEIHPPGPRPTTAVLDTPSPLLVMEGLGRAVPLVDLRRMLQDTTLLAPHSDPFIPLDALSLTGEEAQLVAQADGTKTVADLLALSEAEERPTRALLVAMEAFGVLLPRPRGDANARRFGFVL